ncbi:MAG: hypothetical protein HGA76_07955, partial [Candidatus Firestonebacteria bacterium]|nr:hypothetical protein [Candidatus Firestonebacteria bacterium]
MLTADIRQTVKLRHLLEVSIQRIQVRIRSFLIFLPLDECRKGFDTEVFPLGPKRPQLLLGCGNVQQFFNDIQPAILCVEFALHLGGVEPFPQGLIQCIQLAKERVQFHLFPKQVGPLAQVLLQLRIRGQALPLLISQALQLGRITQHVQLTAAVGHVLLIQGQQGM